MNKNNFVRKNHTKAETLSFLREKIKKSKIEDIVLFTVEKWENEKNEVIQKIIEKFHPNQIIVRSSAIGEDAAETTQAGKYKSIQKISTKSKKEITNAVNEVIEEYSRKNNINKKNQVLIQNQTTNVITNGVVFTCAPENGSPYYIINFSDSKDTDNVTKGETSKLVKIFRKTEKNVIPKKWKKLVIALNEIEKIFNTEYLDIEFGITKKEIIIFQVRPLTIVQKRRYEGNAEKEIKKLILKNQKKYQKLKLDLNENNKKLFFSDMTDWNPAEIIGNNPNPLDYSIYDYLIMKSAWQKGRVKIGYNKQSQKNLMEKFGNKPYVNIVKSFNSLFPENIDSQLKGKLSRYYLDKLEKYPFLHDKVEFDILFSCYDFMFNQRKKELKKYGFTNKEINVLKKSLIKFTNEIITNFSKIKTEYTSDSKKMEYNRENAKENIIKNQGKPKNLIKIVQKLLEDCKKYGTVNFSAMARIAFIGNILLKSLENNQHVSSSFVDELMSSISSPLSEIQKDLHAYNKKIINKKKILEKYGHLRPGTYDITAERYDESQNFLQNVHFSKNMKKVLKKSKKINIAKILKNEGINASEQEFLDFVKDAIRLREVLKFEFTRNLSDSLFLITKIGNSLGFTKEELSYLKINDILKIQNISEKQIQENWKRKIRLNKKKKYLNELLILPPLIFSKADFEIINYNLVQPNFISTKKVTSRIEKISNMEHKSNDFSNKIIIIENADPGYDWIFTKNPAGLITKYGGVASHMAIRCAELGLPAAIGIGEIIFERIESATKILLDCENQQVIVLENTTNDKFHEEKKILKSLGYIK